MNTKVKHYGFAAVVAGLLLSSTAYAGLISNTSSDGNNKTLNCIFNGCTGTTALITSGSPLDVDNEYQTSALWDTGVNALASFNLIAEYAGNAALNGFGLYDANDINNRLTVFNGSDSSGTKVVVNRDANNNLLFKSIDINTLTLIDSKLFSGSSFGFYLSIPGNPFTFYSDSSLNGGQHQMAAFQGDGVRKLNGDTWLKNEWVLAWEDLAYASSDKDFNDLLISAESITPHPVPEPTTLALLGTGLLFSSRLAKRRNKKSATTSE